MSIRVQKTKKTQIFSTPLKNMIPLEREGADFFYEPDDDADDLRVVSNSKQSKKFSRAFKGSPVDVTLKFPKRKKHFLIVRFSCSFNTNFEQKTQCHSFLSLLFSVVLECSGTCMDHQNDEQYFVLPFCTKRWLHTVWFVNNNCSCFSMKSLLIEERDHHFCLFKKT